MGTIDNLDNKIQKGKFKHEQHTSDFYKELNTPKPVDEPFRISDGRWKLGKFKGQKLEDTPQYYISWVLENFKNISNTHKSILKNLIDT